MIVAVLSSTAAGCGGGDKAPYYFPSNDAGARDASSVELDAATSVEPTKPDAAGDPDDSKPGDGCAVRATGAVHAMVKPASDLAHRLTELSLDGQAHELCGEFSYRDPDTREITSTTSVSIRRTDGKVLGLRNGFVYEYVPDPIQDDADAGLPDPAPNVSPFDNDVKLTVPNGCKPNPEAGKGPFSRIILKPDGEIAYLCAADSTRKLYDERHEVLGDGSNVAAIDDGGRILRHVGPLLVSQAQFMEDHGLPLTLRVLDDPEQCLRGSQYLAVRAMDRGFFMALKNRCGIQLWRANEKDIRLVSHYIDVKSETSTIIESHRNALSPDGTLYFVDGLRVNKDLVLDCKGTFCAVKPGVSTAMPTIYEVLTIPEKNGTYNYLALDWIPFN